jgi:hypothetical protein
MLGDEEIAMSPVAAPISLAAGEYELTIENDYFDSITRTIEVSAGETVTIDVDFEREGEKR